MKSIEWRYTEEERRMCGVLERGPWRNEVDAAQWEDPATKLPCMIRRHLALGSWCGYVGVPATHPAFGRHHDKLSERYHAHGGVNFASFCQGEPGRDVCHVVEPGENDRVWWIGFDCCHALDLKPALRAHQAALPMLSGEQPIIGDLRVEYRAIGYVKAECAALAQQLYAAGFAAERAHLLSKETKRPQQRSSSAESTNEQRSEKLKRGGKKRRARFGLSRG